MISLAKFGDEGYDRFLTQTKTTPRGRKVRVVLAIHAPVAHVLRHPCVYFAPKPKWRQYPFVHERNVVRILKHETMHHVLCDIVGMDDRFDRLFPGLDDLP